MTSSDQYRREIMNDLSQGSSDSVNRFPDADSYETFDDFAQRSTKEERRHLFGQAFHPDRISPNQMEPELQQAIARIKPNERADVAREFFNQLKHRGVNDHELEQQLSLSTHHPSRMSAEDVSKLANYTYHNHPDVFQEVLADQPAIVKFLSNPLIGAALGAIAAKWVSHRH